MFVQNVQGINIACNSISKDLNITGCNNCSFMNNTINGQVHMIESENNTFNNIVIKIVDT